jgi:hypothetical protein
MPKIFYKGGFYIEGVHAPDQIPSDAVEISSEAYQALFDGQAQGKRIIAGPAGIPMLADQPNPGDDPAVAMANLRATRNMHLDKTDALVARHRDEKDAGTATTLSDADFKALLAKRQSLRDITKTRKADPWAAHLELLNGLRKP